MSKIDQEKLKLTIYNCAAFLNCYINDVNQKLKELEEHVDSAKSDVHFKTLMVLKKDHEVVSMKFEKFKLEFSEPDSLVILKNIKMDLKNLMTIFVVFMHMEDHLNTKCNELMTEFRKSGVRPAVKEGLLSESGRRAEQGSRFLMQEFGRLKIQDDYVDKKMNGGQKEDTSTLESKELGTLGSKVQENYMGQFLNEVAPAFDRSGLSSSVADFEVCAGIEEEEEDLPVVVSDYEEGDVKRSIEKVTDYGSSDDLGDWTIVEGDEQKIHENKDLLKEEVDNVKKIMVEWIKGSEESVEEREALEAIKDRAIELGTELSFMLFNLMFIMSKRKKLMKRFQEIKSSLRLLIEHESFKLINNMFDLMAMAEGEMREVKKESLEGSSELNLNQLKEGLFDDSQIDKLLVQILKEVQGLDYILRNPGLPVLKMLRKFVSLKQYEEYLNGIETKINELNESYSFIFGSEEVKRFEFRSRALQGKIKEWWNQFGESLGK